MIAWLFESHHIDWWRSRSRDLPSAGLNVTRKFKKNGVYRKGNNMRNHRPRISFAKGKIVLDNLTAYTYHTNVLRQRLDLSCPESFSGQQGQAGGRFA